MALFKCRIADLNVSVNADSPRIAKQCKPYLFDFDGKPDIKINLDPTLLKDRGEKNPLLTAEQVEYLWTGFFFYYKLIKLSGLMIHASAIEYEGKAYLFSAPCGTGKSTHTSLWQKYLGEDKVKIINDDKPAVRYSDDGIFVYGTPWSGKTSLNLNVKVPIGAIVFIERSKENKIRELTVPEAIKNILWQTTRPNKKENMDVLLNTIEKIIQNVPIYLLSCDMSEEAVMLSRNTIVK